MTIQSWWLLKKLKKAQRYEGAAFGIDTETMTARTLYVDSDDVQTVRIGAYANTLEPTLSYLEKCGYIRISSNNCGQVLHPGWHWGQITAGKFISFVIRSIAVPIIVSFLTALVAIWLQTS